MNLQDLNAVTPGAAGLRQVPGRPHPVQHRPELRLQRVPVRLRHPPEPAGGPTGAGRERLRPLDGQGDAGPGGSAAAAAAGPGTGGRHPVRRRNPQRGPGVAAGYSSEYVQALEDAYRQQAAARVSSGSGSRSSGGGNSGGGQNYDGLFAAAMESGHPRRLHCQQLQAVRILQPDGPLRRVSGLGGTQGQGGGSAGVTVSQSNLPDYETILNNSSAGAYGPKYGMVLSMVQNMARTARRTRSLGIS